MYQKPSLQRFGTFRELTLLGLNNASDGASILSTVNGATTVGTGNELCDGVYSWQLGCQPAPRTS